jgi:hypothetical protein
MNTVVYHVHWSVPTQDNIFGKFLVIYKMSVESMLKCLEAKFTPQFHKPRISMRKDSLFDSVVGTSQSIHRNLNSGSSTVDIK